MRIGELAHRAGVSERMLRYYEQEGLLRPARTGAGYRDYDEDDAQVAQRIRVLSAAGLKIDTIRVLLPCMRGDQPLFERCDDIVDALSQEVEKLDRKLDELTESRRLVARYLADLKATVPRR
ncbi:MerR family transcriptional regulator [Pandoraea sp. PE-S2T-3]|uniref:MerR family transcriptional regulator n=1 Tax=Pandoraea sp. PE-S2T-3 TaxID=1986993 RepID=UPI000B4002A6|nr:MerR family transcriptional regulator [Pandoraea sp. PE-S2T-3]